MENLDKIVGYFEPGKTPTYEEFKKSWTSFFHKSEKFPQTQVLGLSDEFKKIDETKATKDELKNVVAGLNPMGNALNIADLNIKPKRNNDSYFVLDQLDENGDPYIYRYDAELDEWINTKQVVYQDVARKGGTNSTVKQVEDKVDKIDSQFEPSANIYDTSLNVIGKLVNGGGAGDIVSSPNWEISIQVVDPESEYIIRNGKGDYTASKVGQLQFQTADGTKIESVKMQDLPDYEGGKIVMTPANCGRVAFNVYGQSTGFDYRNNIEWYKGRDIVSNGYISPEKKLKDILALSEDLENTIINQDAINADLYYKTSIETLGKVGEASARIGGLSMSVGYWNQWLQKGVDCRLDKIRLNSERVATNETGDITCDILIARYNDTNDGLVATNIFKFAMPSGQTELEIRNSNVIVPAGYFALLTCRAISGGGINLTSYGYKSSGAGVTYWFSNGAKVGDNSSTFSNDVLAYDYEFEFSELISLKNNIIDHEQRITNLEGQEPDEKSNVVSVETITDVMFMGSSLTSSHYQPKSHSWIERLNDMVDVVIVNNGVSGQNLVTNMNMLVNNALLNKDSGNTPKNLKAKYIWWNNSANGTPVGLNGITQLRNAMEITASYGAKMLLGSEENYSRNAKAYEDTYKAFAAECNIPYSPMIQVWEKCYPEDNPYKGWIAARHAGYRAMSPYNMHRTLLEAIPIEKSVKIFKVRTTYKGGTPIISDLVYDDNDQRLRYFTAISAGAADSVATNAIDNLDDHTYDVAGGNNIGTSTAETSVMKRNSNISFNKFALVEFILENVRITKGTFEISSTVSPTNIYVAVTKNPAISYTDEPRTQFVALDFSYVGGKITASIVRDDYDIQLYDKVRIIIECDGAFSLINPKFHTYNGVKKVVKSDISSYKYRQYGTEVNPLTGFPAVGHGWALSVGATIKALPSEIANYTMYNSNKSHLQLDNDNAIATKTISIDTPCTKIAVRVVACMWTKLATTRFIGSAIENSEYIDATSSQVTTYDYDYGTLQLRINTNIVKKAIIMQGWHEIYFEVDVNPTDTSLVMELGRKCFVDDSYSNANKPIFIHDVSVQKLK